MIGRNRARVAGVAVAALALLVTSACGGEEPEEDSKQAANESAAELLPEGIRSEGVVKVASTFGYPPEQFYEADGETETGFSVELGEALGEELGIEFDFENVNFDAILPGILSGRYDIAISSMSITPDRAEQVDFVKYFDAGATLLVSGENPKDIMGLEDLCGMTVANNKGSANGDYILEYSATNCEAEGKPAIELDELSGESPYQAISANRVDAAFRDFTANAYAAQSSEGKLQVVGSLVKTNPYGIAMEKGSTELGEAIAAAMNSLIENGTYQKILDKWDVGDGAVGEAEYIESTGK